MVVNINLSKDFTLNHLLSWITMLATNLPIWLSGLPSNDKVGVTAATSALVGLVHIGEGIKAAVSPSEPAKPPVA